ncbi:MAG: hypothetical protein GY857_01010 [Desulfobacula sp.]|nr:hypothetical protein [Desulfobacula sp.]
MPFKHLVDPEKDIVVSKAIGKVSLVDIMSEIQVAINTKRGKGIKRRLIDMTEQEFTYNLEDAQKIFKLMNVSASALGAKKIAILFKEIPDNFKFGKLNSLLDTPKLEIKVLTNRAKAAQFLNKP